MAILKSQIKNKYTTIPNSVIQSTELSDGDFRLLIYLYSLPDGWKISQTYLGQKLGCNRNNINAKISRIKKADFLEIVRLKSDDKDTDYIYILKEKGAPVNNAPVNNALVNNTHINTNIINTNINKNLNNIENIKRIVAYLNQKTNSNYKYASRSTQAKINARLNEGYSFEDFKSVIDKKTDEWAGTDYERYLRPETLFGTKFESYLNQKETQEQIRKRKLDEWVAKGDVEDD